MDRDCVCIYDHPCCENCGEPVDAVLVNYIEDMPPLVFCSYRCFNEYRKCDGGDDGYFGEED